MSEDQEPGSADAAHASDMREKQARRRAMTQERGKHALNLRSADATSYASNGSPMNPADYISEDFLQVLEVTGGRFLCRSTASSARRRASSTRRRAPSAGSRSCGGSRALGGASCSWGGT